MIGKPGEEKAAGNEKAMESKGEGEGERLRLGEGEGKEDTEDKIGEDKGEEEEDDEEEEEGEEEEEEEEEEEGDEEESVSGKKKNDLVSQLGKAELSAITNSTVRKFKVPKINF